MSDGHSELKRQSQPPPEPSDELESYEGYDWVDAEEHDPPPLDRDPYAHRRVTWDGVWPGEPEPHAVNDVTNESLQLRAMGRTWWLLCECVDMDAAQQVINLASTVGWGKNEPAQYLRFAGMASPIASPSEVGYIGIDPDTGRVLLTLDVATCDDERPAFMSGAVVLSHIMRVPLPYVVIKEVPTWHTIARAI